MNFPADNHSHQTTIPYAHFGFKETKIQADLGPLSQPHNPSRLQHQHHPLLRHGVDIDGLDLVEMDLGDEIAGHDTAATLN